MLPPRLSGAAPSASSEGALAGALALRDASGPGSGGVRLKTLSSSSRCGESLGVSSDEGGMASAAAADGGSSGRFRAVKRAEKRLIRHHVAGKAREVKVRSGAAKARRFAKARRDTEMLGRDVGARRRPRAGARRAVRLDQAGAAAP